MFRIIRLKPFVRLVLALGLLVGFGAIHPTDAAVKNELRVAVQSMEKGLDCQSQGSNAAAQVLYNIYDTLIQREPYATPLQYRPGLAVSWKMINPTTMELKLRPNVKLHDGTVMDAEDVAYSLNRVFGIADPNFDTTNGRLFYNFSRVEVVDPGTVRVITKRPDPLIAVLLSDPNAGIVSKEYVTKVGLEQADLMPVGSGPYKVTAFKPGHKVVLEKFADYWGPKAPFERITYTLIEEISSRITALVNNEVDFAVSITPDQAAAVQKRSNLKLQGVTWPMFHVYVLNMGHPVTGNKKIRQAMNLAIDRAALVKGLWAGKGNVPKAHQFKDYGKPLYMPEMNYIRYDPVKAKKLVKESGYDGTPILLTYLPTYYTYGDLAAQAVAEMWKKVGLKVELKAVDVYPSNLSDSIMIRAWSNPMYYPDPMGGFDTHWSKSGWPYQKKMFKPEDPDWDKYYEVARYSTNVAERKAAYKKLNEITWEESPFILLYQPYEYFAMRKELQWTIPKNLRPYTLSFRAGQISVKK